MLNLQLMRPIGKGEIAQAAFDGSRYYRTTDGVYLKDFGHGDSDDSAKLYSGQAVDLDGVDDDIISPSISLGGVTTTTRCFSIKTTDTQFRPSGEPDNGDRFYVGKAILGIGTDYAEHGQNLNDGVWHRVIIVRDGDTGKLYIDGTLAYTITGCGVNPWATITLYNSYTGTTRFLDGQFSNDQIWNAAFTADDVAFDYANLHHMKPAYENPDSSLTSTDLKGWWPLIEGSGDTAYDWSGNGNHGTLTNFPTDDTQWSNADALDSPLVPQTALLEWALKTSNNACVPLNTVDSTNFERNHGELNFNGRSFSAGLNGADVTGAMTATVEMVVNIDDVTALQYLLDATKDAGTGAIHQTAGTITATTGAVYVNNVATTTIATGLCHVVVSGISLNASELFIGRKNDSTAILLGQLPMCKIYEETWDATKLAKYYAKAAAKYGL